MLYWVWLSRLKGVGPIIQKRLLDYFKSPQNIYNAQTTEIKQIIGIGDRLSKNIKKTSLKEAYKILDKVNRLDIKILTYNNPLYPKKAKELIDAPIVLYYKGYIKKDFRSVGIVGARKCTDYGKEVTREAATFLAKNNICVISGMANGIDAYAHTACIKEKGYTIAFLGNSVDICYPKQHTKLMEKIIENGAVISEYFPTTKVRAQHFPKRNRLISSWSNKLLVVEASASSGALITSKYSMKLGRDIFAVPNQIYSRSSKGANMLIKKGAKIYLGPNELISVEQDDVLDEILKINNKSFSNHIPEHNNNKNIQDSKKFVRSYSDKEKSIINFLNTGPKDIRQISQHVNISEIELLRVLSILELNGDIKSIPGVNRMFVI